ncbi:MAG: hypothetical protein R3B81_19450 [bacterium]
MQTTWVLSQRYVDTDVDRARWRSTANVRVLSSLQIGVEFNAMAEEVGPLVTCFLTTERGRRPAVFLGTSSDRIGSPPGKQSYYLTAAKRAPDLPVSAYATLNYSEWDEALNFPFGATLDLGRGLAVQPMYDGRKTHLLLHYARSRAAVSLLWVWLERPGVSVSVGF